MNTTDLTNTSAAQSELKRLVINFFLGRFGSLFSSLPIWNIKATTEGTLIFKRTNRFTHAHHLEIAKENGVLTAKLIGNDWKIECVVDDKESVERLDTAWNMVENKDTDFGIQMLNDFIAARDFN